jgi:hypothetical protein
LGLLTGIEAWCCIGGAPEDEARAHDEQDAGQEQRDVCCVQEQEAGPSDPVVAVLEEVEDVPEDCEALHRPHCSIATDTHIHIKVL